MNRDSGSCREDGRNQYLDCVFGGHHEYGYSFRNC